MATIRALHHSIPLMIPQGDDGKAKVAGSFLSLRFNFHPNSIHVEEEVFNDNGDLSHTVLQMSFCIDLGRVWFLLSGTYKAIGVTESEMATTTVSLTPGVSLTSRGLLFWRRSRRSPTTKRLTCSVMTMMMMCHLPLTLPHLPHLHRKINPSSILSGFHTRLL